MISAGSVIAVVCVYIGALFLIAVWVEKRGGRGWAGHPMVYALSLAVYCTSWTFYGSVGKAATSGLVFLSLYLGTTLAMVSGWWVLRKMVRIKSAHRITSIADFLSARYDRSPWLAAAVTLIVLIGIAPYIALQLKAIFSTIRVITEDATTSSWFNVGHAEIVVVLLMILFTNMFGVRRLDPTERHPGIVVVVAVESVVKLVAFVAVGIFVTYGLQGGFGEIFGLVAERIEKGDELFQPLSGIPYVTWMTYCLLGFFAIMLLPRQFHVAVVENSDESHIRRAMWLFPLYMLLINIFVFPIAATGLLAGLPVEQADTYVLALPLRSQEHLLTLFAFVGGFSAATSMVMISTMTTATMATNHLLLPLANYVRPLGFLRRRLLQCRWVAVTVGILMGYWFERQLSETTMLVGMGVMSFAAVLQFAPAMMGGMFWRRGNTLGAILGVTAGFAVWFYTLLIPAFVRTGWLSESLLSQGPWGLGFLRPEQLLGLSSLDSVSHSVFWSMVVNIGLYVVGSLYRSQSPQEARLAENFVDVLGSPRLPIQDVKAGQMSVELFPKKKKLVEALSLFFSSDRVHSVIQKALTDLNLQARQRVTLIEVVELRDRIERQLAGAVGTSMAHRAMKDAQIFSQAETRVLSAAYAETLVDLNISPAELDRKIDYYRDREILLTKHAEELTRLVKRKDSEIRQRRETEAALREAERKYRNVFEHAAEGIFLNTLDGRFIDANPALVRIFGYRSREDLIRSISDIGTQLYVQPEQRQEVVAWLRRTDQQDPIEIQLLRKSGEAFWASIRGHPVLDGDGNTLYLEGMLQDVTAEKQAAEQQKRLEAQLRQAQKMEALGQLAGGIAHDFNNCLHAISGYTELLIKRGNRNPADAKVLDMIAQVADRASGTVRRLLMFARKTEPTFAAVDVNDVMEHTLQILAHTLPKMITIETSLQPDLPKTHADRFQLEQVLINLAGNACDAMQDGGTLRFESRDVDLSDPESAARLEVKPGPFIRLTVSDSGKGMDEQTQERVFEPFFTTKELGKGTGLGMSVVYGIVRGHGGAILCKSQLDEGTTFDVWLPVRRVTGQAQEPQRESEEEPGEPSGTVLIVDDDRSILEITEEILGGHGFSVIRAESGEEALEVCAQIDAKIDVIILDLGMPGMGGARCLDELKKRGVTSRIIVASGYANHEISREPRAFGADAFVRKPFHFSTMVAEIRDLLDPSRN